MPTVNLNYQAEAEDIARRRKMAEMLQQQALEPIKQETAGGYVVPISWTQGLAKALQGGVGAYQQAGLKKEAQDLSASRNQALAQALGSMPQGTPGTAGVPEQNFTPEAADFADNPNLAPNAQGQVNVPAQIGAQAKPPTMQDNASWLARLGNIGPDAVAMGGTVLGMQQKQDENALNRESKTMDRIMALDAASQNAAATREQRSADAAAAAALRRDLQANQQQFQEHQARQAAVDRAAQARQASADRMAAAGMGRVPPGYRATPEGNLQAIPGGPADLKAVQGESGRGTVSDLVAKLGDYYDQLDKAGGIANPDAGPVHNISAFLGTNPVGQTIGGMLGTKNQTVRDSIAQQRPLLLNAIKQATGMSAKQMDSNAELKLYLSAATDPTKSIKANKDALEMLDKLYGIGGGTPAAQNRRASDKPGAVIDFNSLPK